MGIVHITHLIDDIDGTVLDEGDGQQVRFSIDGRAYEIDLTAQNADELFEAFAPYVQAARSVSTGRTQSARHPAGAGVDLVAVRTWARENGHTVSDRGRVPASIIDAYKSSH
ncbi:Lsr2 family protein [Microbacterium sp. KSW4-17]|uniref:Lsr2 family protein n=1 Tax=Microbacterium galbum TaxID=3075994 RepID=A0ABU3T685_9MICO|nr:Lsr2 family protein [Microbacterium sp. KSW4-17]MDU0366888.1 Lsr2 family protein [Microbacterium sp. KSW4-17]